MATSPLEDKRERHLSTKETHTIILTLVQLNKLSLPHTFLTVNQSDNSLFVISVHKLNEKSVDPDQMASSEAI